MNNRLSFLKLPDAPLHNIYDLLGPVEYARLAATCKDTRLVPKVQKTTDHINTIKRAMNNASTPCPTELILKHRPFAKGVFKDQLDDYIQSYINTKLKTEKTELFWKLREEPGSNEEAKAAHTQYITTRVTPHPLLVFATDEDGWTPLHWAAYKGHAAIAQVLITAGAEVNSKNNNGETPLHVAAYHGHAAVAEALITAGAEVNTTVTDGVHKGDTPLHWAAWKGHKDFAELLIAKGAEVNATVTDGLFKGWTPLHCTAKWGKTDVSELLLANRADVNAPLTGGEYKGHTPLHLAVQNRHKATVKAFIDHAKTDPQRLNTMLNAKNNVNNTPLNLAAKEGHTDIILLLAETEKAQNQSLHAQLQTQQVQIQSLQAQLQELQAKIKTRASS